MNISQRGIDVIKGFEAFKAQPYNEIGNNATIGYGTLLHIGPVNKADRQKYWDGITRERAEQLLRNHVSNQVEPYVNKLTRYVSLSQNQFDALCSFVYNLGSGAFEHSTLFRLVTEGKLEEVPEQMMRFINCGGRPSKGLENRRRLEVALWNEPCNA